MKRKEGLNKHEDDEGVTGFVLVIVGYMVSIYNPHPTHNISPHSPKMYSVSHNSHSTSIIIIYNILTLSIYFLCLCGCGNRGVGRNSDREVAGSKLIS